MDGKELHFRHALHRLLPQQNQNNRMSGGITFDDATPAANGTTTSDSEASTVDPTSVGTLPSSMSDEIISYIATNATSPADDEEGYMRPYYITSISVQIFVCLITLVLNAVILASASWIRRPMSPTLSLSISLAGADAYNALLIGTGLFINSFLPRAFGVKVEEMDYGQCAMLAFEAMRIGGILVSVAHLLALAINHYLGILRPLHYAATLTPRITSILTVALWIFPIAFFFVYFSCLEDQGFQTSKCDYEFLKQLVFRAVFSLLFFVPLILMAVIYLHIYCIVRRTQCSRQRSRLGRHCEEGSRGLVRPNSGDSRSGDSACQRSGTPRSRQLARNWKAVVTTMLILGTYLIGWMPAVLVFLLVCDNCVINFGVNDRRIMLAVYSLTNLLIILKSLSNPIIYAARMQEIKTALGRMKESVFGIPATRGGVSDRGESSHGYGRSRRSVRTSTSCSCCCFAGYDSEHRFYGSDISRNRLSTYASTASGGNAVATTNNVVLFRIKSVHNNSVNGATAITRNSTEYINQCSNPQLHRSSTRSQHRRRDEVRNQITGI